MASVEAQQFAATLHDTPDAEPPTKRAKLSADGEEELDAQAVAQEWKALVEQCAQKLGKKASVVKAYVSEKNLQLQLDALGMQTAARVLQLSRPLSFAIKKQLRKDNVEAEKEVALAIAQAQEELAAGKQRCACTCTDSAARLTTAHWLTAASASLQHGLAILRHSLGQPGRRRRVGRTDAGAASGRAVARELYRQAGRHFVRHVHRLALLHCAQLARPGAQGAEARGRRRGGDRSREGIGHPAHPGVERRSEQLRQRAAMY